jgi:hypothetical protein
MTATIPFSSQSFSASFKVQSHYCTISVINLVDIVASPIDLFF